MNARPLLWRRLTQVALLLLFVGSVRLGWGFDGVPWLAGNFSASRVLGTVPLADPLATLQILATGRIPAMDVWLGALLVVAIYAVLGGRVFCSWVCPMNPISDLAGWLRRRLDLPAGRTIPRSARWWILGGTLVLSAGLGVGAFELVSPISMLHRGIIFGGIGAVVAGLAVFSAELLHHPGVWCSRLCPLGAFYSLVGRRAAVRIRFDAASCTHCGQCKFVCPEPQVLDLVAAARIGHVASADCTNCGRCTEECPESSLAYAWRPSHDGAAPTVSHEKPISSESSYSSRGAS